MRCFAAGMLSAPELTRRIDGRARVLRAVLFVLALAPSALLLALAIDRAWMDDDAFINLRVVRNVLAGEGPVYNPGERIEASTSPLWLLVLCAAGALRLPLERVAVYGGIAMTIAGLVAAQRGALAGADARDRAAPSLPLGAFVFAVIPAVWDYASSGLETGLAFLWLGASYLAIARAAAVPGRTLRSWLAAAALAGAGPLVRPELALYSAALLASLAYVAISRTRGPRTIAAILAAAVIAPCAYEVFRMGYYAALVPNTALAKEAFALNAKQGLCYARNFFGLYKLALPLAGLVWFWLVKLGASRRDGDRPLFVLNAALPLAAIVHAAYVVAIGGDYMHGRMFLPALFAGLAPVSMVTFRYADTKTPYVASAIAAAIVAWMPLCALKLRVDRENVCGIGDERGWYARTAGRKNPIALDDYRDFTFYRAGAAMLDAQQIACPSEASCRRVLRLDEEPSFRPPRSDLALDDAIAPRATGVITERAIGIVGYLAPPSVHVVDRHGLADPVASRLELRRRGRPGHEKFLSDAWIAARFTKPERFEDASIAAARRALACGDLRVLDRAVHEPLTASRFFENVVVAVATRSMHVPNDPFEAEAKYCGTPLAPVARAGGAGGAPYRWSCPDGLRMTSLRASVDEHDGLVATVAADCGPAVLGPDMGERATAQPTLACRDGEAIVGLHGSFDRIVRSVGLLCAPSATAGEARRADAAGPGGGAPFEARCPEGLVATGLAGRSGARVDAAGVVCGTP